MVANADDGSYGELELDVGEDGESDVVVELEARVSIEGTVVNATGSPVSDAKVAVKRIDVAASAEGFTFTAGRSEPFGSNTPTGEDGAFVALGLFSFSYMFFAFWQHLAENITNNLRKRYLAALMH